MNVHTDLSRADAEKSGGRRWQREAFFYFLTSALTTLLFVGLLFVLEARRRIDVRTSRPMTFPCSNKGAQMS
jgi:preprotein translocase subunit SecY